MSSDGSGCGRSINNLSHTIWLYCHFQLSRKGLHAPPNAVYTIPSYKDSPPLGQGERSCRFNRVLMQLGMFSSSVGELLIKTHRDEPDMMSLGEYMERARGLSGRNAFSLRYRCFRKPREGWLWDMDAVRRAYVEWGAIRWSDGLPLFEGSSWQLFVPGEWKPGLIPIYLGDWVGTVEADVGMKWEGEDD
ncbi:hypothetical protein B0T21DRAFT_408993 [Apiosordaria backusii]|uniref:Uncharacterized protein n=1 Tax=Apiosordaria backusii TaxID=314023 RepID=A0AA40K159_9PEZI|nr:hypothetical protein B0T21DRAFT_408993 [Apiosordaria backusii]